MEGRVLPGDGVLGVAAVGGAHLVEGGYAVAGLEFEDFCAHGDDGAGYVVAFVCGAGEEVGDWSNVSCDPTVWGGKG